MSGPAASTEFGLIDRIRARARDRADVLLGIGDDAALLQMPVGRHLVVAMDTLNQGVHFPGDARAADIGWKALAVNLSDLAAMGAEPAWCTLSLSLPQADITWLDAFLDGFLALADLHGVALVGGDTTRGPLSICVTVHGFVEPGRALRRDGARVGDDVWIAGLPGHAAAALALRGLRTDVAPVDGVDIEAIAMFEAALARPVPQVALGRALGGRASSAIDISDGLLTDLAHVARASHVAMSIDVDCLPISVSLDRTFNSDARRRLQATGGDDYVLAFTADAGLRAQMHSLPEAPARIGAVLAGTGVQAVDGEGRVWSAPYIGYVHFTDDGKTGMPL